MKYYTGVGSRETPEHILKFIEQVAYWLAGRGYTGRSGSVAGADSAFEQGFNHHEIVNGSFDHISFEAYLPWKGFSDIREDNVHIVTPELPNYNPADHPGDRRCATSSILRSSSRSASLPPWPWARRGARDIN